MSVRVRVASAATLVLPFSAAAGRRAGGHSRTSFPRVGTQLRQPQPQQQYRYRSSSSSDVVTISDQEATQKFTELNQKSVLYFTATWCPPCKAIKPFYEQLATKYGEEVHFGKIDIDDNQESAMKYQINSVPTFVFFKDHGTTKYGQFSGADQDQLEKLITDLIKE